MKKLFLITLSLGALTACTETWSERSITDGTPLNVAQMECRAKAQESVRRQMPIFNDNYMPGPGGFRLIPRAVSKTAKQPYACNKRASS